jgi:hypothetical protein
MECNQKRTLEARRMETAETTVKSTDKAGAVSMSFPAPCSVAGCDNPAGASGLCDRCFLDKQGGSVWQPKSVANTLHPLVGVLWISSP